MDELVEVRRSRQAGRWTLSVPWGAPAQLTAPAWMPHDEVERVLESHREWIAAERARQRPRLRLDPHRVSEVEARLAVRELVRMLAEEEAPELGVEYARIEIRDQRTRWGSCSTRGTLSFNWRLVLAPSRCSTTSSCTSSATCGSRTTRAASGGSSRRGAPTGVCSATG